jgi:LysM repeat protein
MTLRADFFRWLILALAWTCLSGCAPSGSGPQDEEKEPHFLAGKNRISALDYKGAIECFEKALQVNPKSASAHFELAWIFDEKEVEPAAAIYHYEQYLQLRRRAENGELARQRIMVCKQALAETVSLGPVTDKIQRQLEQLVEENKRLTEDKKRLQEELDKWGVYAARLQTLTNQATSQSVPTARVAQPRTNSQPALAVLAQAAPPNGGSTSVPSASNRTHAVKAGDTPTLIARKYGVKLEALMAANPNLDPRRLKVGQLLRIPGS